MLHASPGFIILVDTPTLGTLTMLAEDAADRYLIIGLENRTTNRVLFVLARSFLNRGRSFANAMAFKNLKNLQKTGKARDFTKSLRFSELPQKSHEFRNMADCGGLSSSPPLRTSFISEPFDHHAERVLLLCERYACGTLSGLAFAPDSAKCTVNAHGLGDLG
jgi:hypothetical protein